MNFNWKQPLLKMALNLISGYIEKKVKDLDIKNYLSRRMDDLQAGVLLIIDKNPDNKEQFKQLFEERKAFFIDDNILQIADQLNDRVKDEFAKTITVSVLVQFANEDGTPITPELKAAYPNLPWGTIQAQPITKFSRGSGRTNSSSKMEALANQGLTLESVFNEGSEGGEAKKETKKAVSKPKEKTAAKAATKEAPKTKAGEEAPPA